MLKQTGKKPKQLEGPEIPLELWYIWAWHSEVFSGDQLTYQEIAAWAALKEIRLLPDEVSIIRYIDRIFWRVQHEGHKS